MARNSTLRVPGGNLGKALAAISVPSYVLDTDGVVRWLNPAAQRLVGDVSGRPFTTVVAPEDTRKAREHFARKIAGREPVTDARVVLLGTGGRRFRVDISSVPLTDDHHLVGVFGQVAGVEPAPAKPPLPELTPRQAEVLHLLEQGRSTEQIASQLHLSQETVRNHVRRLLRALDVHTRLEAVARARQARNRL